MDAWILSRFKGERENPAGEGKFEDREGMRDL
jgi:hypothetical protein